MGRGARAAAEDAGDLTPRWRGSGLTRVHRNRCSGGQIDRLWVCRDQRVMHDLPGAKAGLGVL
jgi:hypothetical protein